MRLHSLVALALWVAASAASAQTALPWVLAGTPAAYNAWTADQQTFYGVDVATRRPARSTDGSSFEALSAPYASEWTYRLYARDGLLVAGFGWTPIGLPNPNGNTQVSNHAGIAVSQDQGTTWITHVASEGIPAREFVQAFVDDPSTNRIYAAVAQTLYRSDDGGRSWNLSATGLPQSTSGSPVQFIVYDVTFRNGIGLLATSLGVYRSENGGDSWSPDNAGFSSDGLPPEIWCVAFDDDGRIFAGIYYSDRFNGVWRRDAAGWTRLPLPRTRSTYEFAVPVVDLLATGGFVFASASGIAELGTGDGDHDGVYVSSDGGDSWTGIPDGLPPDPGAGTFGLFRKGGDVFVQAGGGGSFRLFRRPLSGSTDAVPSAPSVRERLRVSPNPARFVVTLRFPPDATHADVYDALGRRVAAVDGASPLQIDVSAFPSGTYVARTIHDSIPFVVAR